ECESMFLVAGWTSGPSRLLHASGLLCEGTTQRGRPVRSRPRLPSVQLRHLPQSGEMPGPEHLWPEPPGPVAVGPAGMIHPGLAAQHEHILERHDYSIGDRTHAA